MENSLTAIALLALICCLLMMLFSQSSFATFSPGDAVTVMGNMTASLSSGSTNESTVQNSSSNSSLQGKLMNETGLGNWNETR